MRFLIWAYLIVIVPVWSLQVELAAPSAILINADTGAVLYEKQAHVKKFPGSITKIVTALYALEEKNVPLDQMLTVSYEALRIKPRKEIDTSPNYWDEVEGTKMGLVKGEVLSLESLLQGLMRRSGNDAANVIADQLSPSIPHFIEELNQYVQRLGCTNTHFCNPHGLHHEDHYTTAYDMAQIMKKALQNPKFREIASNSYYLKPKSNKQPASEICHTLSLLKAGKFYYPKTVCGKTGVHSKAKYTVVAAAEDEGRTLIAVLLGCKSSPERSQDAITLFEAAFAEKKTEKTLFHFAHSFKQQLEGAKDSLDAALVKDVTISYFPSEEPQCRAYLHWDSVNFPIAKGQKVGEIHICNEQGTLLASQDLIAKNEVTPTFLHKLKSFFR